MRPAAFVVLAALAGCAAPPDAHIPPFARTPYEAISRDAIVQIALREWRLFGQIVDLATIGAEAAGTPNDSPERQQGLWQRVGEYWWLGLHTARPEANWTGKHDATGRPFPASADGNHAWSAAFISYVLRVAGAGSGFSYAPSHWDYIDRARLAVDKRNGGVFIAERPETHAPQPGDLICFGRGQSAALRYEHLPAGPFPAHCDIVVAIAPGQLDVIGGNVRDAVTMKHVPITAEGRLARPDGTVLDARFPWMVVLRMAVSTPVS